MLGSERDVDAHQCVEGHALVVPQVKPGKVLVQVRRQQLGVLFWLEAGQGDAAAAAGIDDLAGEQQLAELVAEFSLARDGDQPGGLAFAPAASEKDGAPRV
ncbi:hypothetical protein KDK95_16375 [Actinospica sp. MGRD01-02]|uniref:Uncharacterized protein n=1 Tax=Actinospica acidithermotolerans TaxID=2828514 RepID=A0A941IGX7_9ACTN|nr:hypothetical protein [Actinospica acidithermotolerans]MBR7827895.1 hypothetical protein [Actinospica acidithermotolerans]